MGDSELERTEYVPVVVFRYQHCTSAGHIFSLSIPAKCASCGQSHQPHEFILPPVCVFPPWTTSSRAPGSIVIKPTVGGFLTDYHGLEDLHIGVADSNGYVTHYLQELQQIQVDSAWKDCIAIPIDEQLSNLPLCPGKRDQEWCRWDNTLAVFTVSFRQRQRETRSLDPNCFDFVWGFVSAFWLSVVSDGKDVKERCLSKECFTEHFVLPAINKALQFKRMYKAATASTQKK
ncbi:hypothetical protein RvY_09300 [Ramazzottius varieornatus]|uniref:MKRN2 opposite strand protein-like C-terminal domain-containing protein n=1 Tax=Ramazzottius varieornatus TaxID=947166 RepID=A0A1D1V8X5_RAMVA|nr:hypothetical protein RvY_09300 [Ramazzottius varieornatus]